MTLRQPKNQAGFAKLFRGGLRATRARHSEKTKARASHQSEKTVLRQRLPNARAPRSGAFLGAERIRSGGAAIFHGYMAFDCVRNDVTSPSRTQTSHP